VKDGAARGAVRLSRKARVQPDPRDGRPVLLSPERGLRLGETAAAIVALCDGTRDTEAIVDELAVRFGAERGRVARDVEAFLADLHGRALLEGFAPASAPAPAPASAPASAPPPPRPMLETVPAVYVQERSNRRRAVVVTAVMSVLVVVALVFLLWGVTR